jgi:hypothetical protein
LSGSVNLVGVAGAAEAETVEEEAVETVEDEAAEDASTLLVGASEELFRRDEERGSASRTALRKASREVDDECVVPSEKQGRDVRNRAGRLGSLTTKERAGSRGRGEGKGEESGLHLGREGEDAIERWR